MNASARDGSGIKMVTWYKMSINRSG